MNSNRVSHCGTLYTMRRCVDVYESDYGKLEIFDGIDCVSITESELIYLIEISTVLDWRMREKYVATSGRVMWF